MDFVQWCIGVKLYLDLPKVHVYTYDIHAMARISGIEAANRVIIKVRTRESVSLCLLIYLKCVYKFFLMWLVGHFGNFKASSI